MSRVRVMSWAVVTALALGVVWAAFGTPAFSADNAADKAARQQLVGVWKGYVVEGKGDNPNTGPVQLELTITAESIHGIQIKDGKPVDHGVGEFTLDLAATPKKLDATQTNARGNKKNYLGIYSVEGDTLKWCVSPKDSRPTEFASGKGTFLLILKRQASK